MQKKVPRTQDAYRIYSICLWLNFSSCVRPKTNNKPTVRASFILSLTRIYQFFCSTVNCKFVYLWTMILFNMAISSTAIFHLFLCVCICICIIVGVRMSFYKNMVRLFHSHWKAFVPFSAKQSQ